MLESLKKRIAKYLIKKKFLKTSSEVRFNNFMDKSVRFLIIMPENDHDFNHSFDVAQYLVTKDKSVTVLCQAPRVSTIIGKEKYKIIWYDIGDISKFYLPEHKCLERFGDKEFDVVIDLNKEENLFCSAIANFFKSKYRVGFQKNNADLYYNFQILNEEINSEISYRNLLNSLQMF